MGTLLNVGRGKITPDEFKQILDAKNRRLAGETVPAKGLCLMEVKYRDVFQIRGIVHDYQE